MNGVFGFILKKRKQNETKKLLPVFLSHKAESLSQNFYDCERAIVPTHLNFTRKTTLFIFSILSCSLRKG